MIIGFVGTGAIGLPIATALLRAGHELRVHDRDGAATDDLLHAGGLWCATPAAVAHGADMVFLALPSHEQVEAVCFARTGLVGAMRTGTFLVDLTPAWTTLVSRLTQAQQAGGFNYVAAPISRAGIAHPGGLALFVGGALRDCEACAPVLSIFATSIIRAGDQFSTVGAELLWVGHAAVLAELLLSGARTDAERSALRRMVLPEHDTHLIAADDVAALLDAAYVSPYLGTLCRRDLELIAALAAAVHAPIMHRAALVAADLADHRTRPGVEGDGGGCAVTNS